jgi:iron complex outermembrane receptor protein
MRTSLLTCASAMTLIAAASPAFAQQAPATAAPQAVDDTTGVTDIIVTAQRIAQSLQRVPVSVQPVTGQELETRKLSDLVQLQSAVPSLGVGTDNSFSLRGVGSLNFSPNVDSSVGVAVDDVSLGVPLFMNYFGFEDVDRVEVLLGPQGLLFGRNASAGLLSVVTKRPDFNGVSGHVYGETDYRDTTPGGGWGEIVRGTINLPLASNAAFRLNGFYSNQDPIAAVVNRSAGADFGNYQRRFGLKGKLLFEPTDRLSIYLIGDFAQNRGIGGIYDRTLRHLAPGSLTALGAAADGITPGPNNLQLGYSAPTGGLNVDTGGASATISYKASDAITISNIFAWRAYHAFVTGDLDFTSLDGVDLNRRVGTYRQFSNEFRVAIDAGPLVDGQIGAYFFNSHLTEADAVGAAAYGALGPFNSNTAPLIGSDIASRVKAQSIAGFGQFNIHPVERVTLILGGRVTHDDNSTQLLQNQLFYPIPLGANHYAASERVKNTDFSWKVGGQYTLGDVGMVYASFSRGYKGPAFNDTAAVAGQKLAIGPETVHALELGAKTTFFDHRLRVNVAAFRELFNDFQVQGFDVTSNSYYTANAAKVNTQGIEAFIEARPVKALTLSAAATLLDSTFTRYPNDHCYPGQTCPAGFTNSAGNRTPSSAKFTSTLGAVYERPMVKGATLALSGSWYHRSSVNFSSNANPQTFLGAIDTFDGSIGTTIDGRFKLAVFCKNCTDKRYPIFIGSDSVDSALLGVNSTVQTWGYNSIRTIGISASAAF